MVRLTINFTDRTHSALKEAAARRNCSMGSIIEESLQARRIQPLATARKIVTRAHANSSMDAAQATVLALEDTRNCRAGH